MLYAILIHGSEAAMAAAAPDAEEDLLERESDLREDLQAQGRLGAVLRLMPDAAITVRHAGDLHPQVATEPFAATREQLMGLYVVDCESAEDAIHLAHRLAFDTGVFEVRPVTWYDPGALPARVPQV